MTEKRERTAAAAARSRSDLGLRCEYREERDHDYPEKAQVSGKSKQGSAETEQTHNSTYLGLKLRRTGNFNVSVNDLREKRKMTFTAVKSIDLFKAG